MPDQDLPAIYSAASVFAFPSLYEGFGMPIRKPCRAGRPSFARTRHRFPRWPGTPRSSLIRATAALALELERVLDDPILHASLSLRGLAHAAPYSWERAARSTLEVYQRALADRRA